MTRFGVRYRAADFEKPLESDIPFTISDDILYITDSDKHPLEQNIKQLTQLIQSMNKQSSRPYTFQDIVTTNISPLHERIDRHYGVRDNEFSSYLEALAQGRQSWKGKFFIIRDNFLLYFRDQTSRKPEGVITLEGSEITISKEYTHCFEIASPTRRYHLRATSFGEVMSWVQKLKEASAMTIDTLYEMKEVIGQGTFAKVKRATERATGKEFAVKIINKSAMAENRENIMTEITILKNVHHPNIINLHHVFENRHKIYLVMELLEGGELFDLIVKRGCLTEAETSKVMRQVIQAVAYLHMKRICHRDLKPENILLGRKGDIETVRITDFGLSKISDHMLHTACGTPSYVAPEILTDDAYGFEVDMWSCGVILYVLLCGFPPFYADNDAELHRLIQSASYSFPSPYWDDISDTAKDLIRRLLVVDPSKRLTPVQTLCHPFITNHRSLSFIRRAPREMSSYLIKQRNVKNGVGTSPQTRRRQPE